MPKIKTKKIKKKIYRFCEILAQRTFVSFLVLFFIILFISGIIFYIYGYLIVNQEVEIQTKQIQINDELYNQFLEYYIQRKDVFNSTDIKEYDNPFKF